MAKAFWRLSVLVAVMAAVAACSETDVANERTGQAAAPALDAGQQAAVSYAQQTTHSLSVSENNGPLLAYSYSMGASVPKNAVEPMMAAHQKKCRDAGPLICQLLGSSLQNPGKDFASASLDLRAKPEWIETFRNELRDDAQAAGGRLTSDTATTVDLTRHIVDTDAQLKAKLKLSERIRDLLETNTGSLGDILAAERELSRVLGEIDSFRSQLTVAQARVEMSQLQVSYRADADISNTPFAPVFHALRDFSSLSLSSLADAIRFVANSWAYFILLALFLIILRRWWRRRR